MERKLRVLYAEDNLFTADINKKILERNGFEVQSVHDGNKAWEAFQACKPDVVLLDHQMPGKNGIDVFLLIRKTDTVTPVLIMSELREISSAVLNIGTDDFIHKGTSSEEMITRIKIAYKRSQQNNESKEPIKEPFSLSSRTTFNPNLRMLRINGERQELSVVIAQLLELFCLNQNQPVSNKYICQHLWRTDQQNKVRLLQNYIMDLRQYLQADPELKIRTNYGCGYTFLSPCLS